MTPKTDDKIVIIFSFHPHFTNSFLHNNKTAISMTKNMLIGNQNIIPFLIFSSNEYKSKNLELLRREPKYIKRSIRYPIKKNAI